MAEIAQAAGVGRVTLYGHFSSRRELIDAIVEQTMHEAEAQLAPLSLDGDPLQALDRLVRNATVVGANAIVSMRYDSSELSGYMSEIVAYGTAVVVEPDGSVVTSQPPAVE